MGCVHQRSNQDDLHSCFHVADVGQEVLAKSDPCPGDVDPRPGCGRTW